MRLPEGWSSLTGESSRRLNEELHREVCAGHVLHGRQARAVARRADQDDVLFEVQGSAAPFYVVHLTWNRETSPQWPGSAPYESLEDFFERWPRDEFDDEDR